MVAREARLRRTTQNARKRGSEHISAGARAVYVKHADGTQMTRVLPVSAADVFVVDQFETGVDKRRRIDGGGRHC